MASGLGRNVFFGCEHFSLALDDLLDKKFNTRCVYDICLILWVEELSRHTVVLCVCLSKSFQHSTVNGTE